MRNLIHYVKTLRARGAALRGCQRAREEFPASVNGVAAICAAHPVPILAGATGVGFLVARLRIGSGPMRTALRFASDPAWHLVRQFIAPPD